MAPLPPPAARTHPDIQEVRLSNGEDFNSASFSKVKLEPFALFAKFEFPPCTRTSAPTYATVQMSVNSHLFLNTDLVYINHSCSPSLIFDMSNLSILAGPLGLQIGQELTFFYPSTEWDMDQSFTCTCTSLNCHGLIRGAKHLLTPSFLARVLADDLAFPTIAPAIWFNDHIAELFYAEHGIPGFTSDLEDIQKPLSLREAGSRQMVVMYGVLRHAQKYWRKKSPAEQEKKMGNGTDEGKKYDAYANGNGWKHVRMGMEKGREADLSGVEHGNGIGSRALSGEMGGDTVSS